MQKVISCFRVSPPNTHQKHLLCVFPPQEGSAAMSWKHKISKESGTLENYAAVLVFLLQVLRPRQSQQVESIKQEVSD